MSKFALSQAPPDVRKLRETEDGDAIFVGMDMKTPREYLANGYYPLAINKRASDGRLTTRNGTVMPKNANILSFGTILGTGVFSNPNRKELLLIATAEHVYGISDSSYPETIAVAQTLSGPCTFDQNFDKIYLNNANVTLVWDGLSPTGFVLNTQFSPGDTTLAITPNVAWSQNVANRRIGPLSNDSIFVTPINDYTEYNFNPLGQAPSIGSFRLNTGTSDQVIGVFPYAQGNLIIGKRYSIDILANFSGDLSQASMNTLSSELGICSRKAVKMVGADMIFPFDTGIYRIQQVIQDRIAATAIPVAAYVDQYGNVVDPIEPLLRRINWKFAGGMTAAVLAPYYFLAVPLDSSEVNNAILVYNTVKDKWEGYDQWQDNSGNNLLQIDDLWITRYQGLARVYCIDFNASAVYVLYEGKSDLLATGEDQIHDVCETRGYGTLSSLNQYKRAEIGLSTWWPSITVSELTDQYNDARLLTRIPVTKDPSHYGIFGVTPYLLDNSNSDFDNVGRADYSIDDGTYFDNGGSGINIEQTQQSVLRFATMARGRWISYRIENNQGQASVDGILMSSEAALRQKGAAAA